MGHSDLRAYHYEQMYYVHQAGTLILLRPAVRKSDEAVFILSKLIKQRANILQELAEYNRANLELILGHRGKRVSSPTDLATLPERQQPTF